LAKTRTFLHRACPLCGAAPPANSEVASRVTAESMRYEDLIPYWNGFFKEKVFFSYVRCPSCHLLYNATFFDSEALSELYAQMAPNMDVVPPDMLRATQRGYYEALRRRATFEGGYLEVGPDVGLFTEYCVQAGGFDHYWLFEPNRQVAPALSAAMGGNPFSIVHDMFDFSPTPDGTVGVAVLIHVLDHLVDPMASLREIRRKLKPGGKILIVTHDESSLLRRVFGAKWPPFCLQHPQLYGPRSMRALLTAAGYRDVRLSKTVNHFPVQFLVKQLLWACGIKVERVPDFGGLSIGLKLGNMMTLATA
jgi:SAM-dependent methyltransferase